MIVSIVIAVKKWQDNLAQCLSMCQELETDDLEIIVLPDVDFPRELLPKGKFATGVIPTGPLSPAKKRDLSLGHARGEIIALIDDDTYPKKDWLKNALGHFQDAQVAAVGGPAITPREDSLRQKASGAVYASFLASGKFTYRYIPGRLQEVDDYPSCNFLVRKSVMLELGGFKTNFWPGEDTKLCLEITHILKQKIIYDPQVILFHHRRPLFMPHLRQVMSYALHRGYFVKRFPETSLRPYYFVPSIFLFFNITTGIAGLFFIPARIIFLGVLAIYLAVVLSASVVVSMRQKLGAEKLIQNAGLVILIFLGIVLTHIAYGSSFFQGLFSCRLKEEL